MSIAITEEHLELSRVARSFLESNEARAENRAQLEAEQEQKPSFWKDMAELGWMGLHVPEQFGGQGFGLPELSIVLEELGYAVAPGPFLPTALAAAILSESGSDELRKEFLPKLADGSTVGTVGLTGELAWQGGNVVEGSAGLVLSATLADLLLLPVGDDLVLLDADQEGLAIETLDNMDRGRRVSSVSISRAEIPADRILRGGLAVAKRLARVLSSAEAAGGARACTEMASEYAKQRVQFGRPIGTFQAVKHHCANMLVWTEQATAGAWAAARPELEANEAKLAAAIASSLALPAFEECAQLSVQVHGGIGFTWEHDCHLYLRRAVALQALMGPVDEARTDVTQLMREGVRSRASIELPPEAEEIRKQVRGFIAEYQKVSEDEQRKALSDAGYLMPHWPKPWGRDAGPVEQLVIDEEFAAAGLIRPNMGISGWNTLTIAQHGSPEQVERWVRPSLEGEIEFCQLFSEPGAGSDAAGVQTRGVKVDGGWRITGQKVWTSGAHLCNRGFATVRTDPDAAKHAGISMMVLDMHAEGVEVRPLRQVTGHSHFNEVFFDNVFIPDGDVVGPVNAGWTVARSTLGNERVSIGGQGGGMGQLPVLALMQEHAPDDVGVAREVGAVLAEGETVRLLNLRRVARAVAGSEPGAEGNVTKLVGSEIGHKLASLGARIVGSRAAVTAGKDAMVGMALLATRGMSIAGGTSEIVRNQIAERILGLPRDPLIK